MNVDDIASNGELLYFWGRYIYRAESKCWDLTEKVMMRGEPKAEWVGRQNQPKR